MDRLVFIQFLVSFARKCEKRPKNVFFLFFCNYNISSDIIFKKKIKKKVIKKNVIKYMLNERALKTRLIAGLIRRHSIDVLHKINQSFSKLNERSSGNAKIELDLSN